MTLRSDVSRLSAANRRLVDLALNDLQALFSRLPLSTPDVARDLLVEAYPALVAKYGEIGATVAAEWYEVTRAAQVAGTYTASLGEGAAVADVAATARAKAGALWGDNPQAVVQGLAGATQRYVMAYVRDTIAKNVAADPANPRWARVPSGAKTCAFCVMMASRGFTYSSPDAASGFHDDCDCQIVPEWSKSGNPIKGYDPDGMYELYEAARERSGSGSARSILREMRRMYPDRFTDGVFE